ncbi:MAG TPA: polysaccharide deacetylase family protein [Methylibium sp.]|nr:polysaccharide deacetylase family protein [Methylibium sp.]
MTVAVHRWAVKKIARRAVVLGSAARTAIAPRSRNGPTVRVLTYHRFGTCRRDPWCVDVASFEAQMRWLGESGLAVSLDDLLAFTRGEKALADGSVLVTMDDGYSSVWTVAAPIMQRYGIPGVAYVTTGLVGVSAPGERYLSWDEVARLYEAGLTVGSHAHTHRSIAKLSPDEARSEALRSKDLLESCTGRPVHSFAYPFGMRPDENPATAQLLLECGYRSVFIAQHGTVLRGADPARLPRVKVEGGDPLWLFKRLCQGGMDAWRHVDDSLWRLQRSAMTERIA